MRPRHLATLLGAAGAALVLPAAPAPAQDQQPCPDEVGVTVIVDFQELGGGILVRCTGTAPTSGLDALRKAGIRYQTAARFPGFVCRIEGLPTTDPCQGASPATAYWGYWVAPRGGSWCYSSLGAANRTPPPGTVEGWSFSLNRPAGDPPPPRLAPPPALPGTTPTPLPASHCASTAVSPTTTTTVAPPTAPPTTRPTTAPPATPPLTAPTAPSVGPATSPATAPPAAPAPGLPAPAPASPPPPGAPPATAPATAAPTPAPAPEPTAAPLDDGPTTTGAAPAEPSTTAGRPPSTTTVAGDEAAAPVVAADVTERRGGSPVGLLVTAGLLATVAALTWRWRRRRPGAPVEE